MAEPTTVSAIGVRLVLDTSDWSAALARAAQEYASFKGKVGGNAGGGGSGGSGGRVTLGGGQAGATTVPVSLTVSQAEITKLREQIIKGLGSIPIQTGGVTRGSGGGSGGGGGRVKTLDDQQAEADQDPRLLPIRYLRTARTPNEHGNLIRRLPVASVSREQREAEAERRIRMVPRTAVSAEQREAERASARAQNAMREYQRSVIGPSSWRTEHAGMSSFDVQDMYGRMFDRIDRQAGQGRPPSGPTLSGHVEYLRRTNADPGVVAQAAARLSQFQRDPVRNAREAAARFGNASAPGFDYLSSAAQAEDWARRNPDAPAGPEWEAMRQQITLARLGVLGQSALTPSRTGRGGVAAIIGNTIGGRQNELRKQAEARMAQDAYAQALGALEPSYREHNRFRDEQREKLDAGTITQEQYNAALETNFQHVVKNTDAYRHAAAAEERMVKATEAAQVGFTGMARNIVSVAGGIAVYGVIAGVASQVLGAAAQAGELLVDQATGFTGRGTKTATALGTSIVANRGNIGAALAGTTSAAGLSDQAAALIGGLIGPSGTAVAGAQQLGTVNDLFRGALGLGGRPTGLYGGYGGLFGGPAFAQQLGGGLGFAESIAKALREQSVAANPVATTKFGLSTIGLGGQLPYSDGASGKVLTAIQLQAAYIENLNDASKRAASYLGMAADSAATFTKDVDKAAQVAADTSLPPEIRDIAKEGFILQRAGQALSGTDLDKALQQMALGTTLATPSQFTAQAAQQFAAQRQSSRYSTRLRINTLIPGALGAQLAAQPFTSAGAGINAVNGDIAATVSRAQALQDAITSTAATSFEAQAQWVQQMSGQGAQYRSLMADAHGFGVEIAKLNEDSLNRQAALSAKEYANNLRLANRAVADAAGLSGTANGSLGALQRQEFMVGRQSQSLSLGMSQRQINFQMAVAGFAAPGTTAEERAARIAQAKVEAEYAQQQLDLQKQQFGITGDIFALQASRAQEDATKARELVGEQYAANQQIAANAKVTAALQLQQQQAVESANALLGEAQGNFDGALNVATQYVATFGQAMGDLTTVLTGTILPALGFNPANTPATKYPNRLPYGETHAAGYSATVSGATPFIAGEAGTEHVVVLRNPRAGWTAGASSGGGGSVQFTFINNGSVRNDGDLAAMQQMFNDWLNQKAALQGLRGALIG